MEGVVYERLADSDTRQYLLKRGSLLCPEVYGEFNEDKSWEDIFESLDEYLDAQRSHKEGILKGHRVPQAERTQGN